MTALKFGSVNDQPQESAEHRGAAQVPEARSSASEAAQRQVASRSDAKCENVTMVAAKGDDNRLSSPANPVRPPGLAQAAPKPASKDTSHAMNQPPQASENQDAREKPSKSIEAAGQQQLSSTASHQLPPSTHPSKEGAFTSVGGQGTPEPRPPNPEAQKHHEERQARHSGQEDQHEVWKDDPIANTPEAPSTPIQPTSPSSQEGRVNDPHGRPYKSRNTSHHHRNGYYRDGYRQNGSSEGSKGRSRDSEQSSRDDSRHHDPHRERSARYGDRPPRESPSQSSSNSSSWQTWFNGSQSQKEIKELKEKNKMLVTTAQNYANRVTKTESDLEEAEQRIADSKALAETRLVELKAFQELMPMNDGVSGADLKSKWEALNNEIEQTAAIIVDSLVETPVHRPRPLTPDSVQGCLRYFSDKKIFDMRLLSLVQNPGTVDPSLFIQIALQACMVQACRRLVTSIAPFHAQEIFIFEIGCGIQGSAPFPVFAKWRALTHAQCLLSADEQRQLNGLLDPLQRLLYLAGRVDARDEDGPLLQDLRNRLWGLLSMARELNTIIMQQIFTMQADAFGYGPGEVYHPNTMQSDIPSSTLEISDPSIDPSRVVCSTGMGLFFTKDTPSGREREYAVKAKVETQLIFID